MGVLLPSTTGALISSAIGMAMSLIPYKKNLYDLSTQNTTVSIEAKVGTSVTMIPLVRKFADDRDAIEISPMEWNETSTSYNGKLMVVGKIPKVRVTLSLIPHSEDDIALAKVASEMCVPPPDMFGDRNRSEIKLTITQPRIDEQAAAFQLIGVGGAKQGVATAMFYSGALVNSSAIGNYQKGTGKHGSETTASREGRHVASQYVFEFTETSFFMA